STLTEETRDAKRTMPKAILITALAGGLIFVVSAYITQLAHPGMDFVSIDAAAPEIAKAVGERGDEDRLRHGALGVPRFLGQRREGVEAEEGIGGDCGTGDRG
ncbi:hypothetical protein ACCS81_38070, partial [Rhizobium ruizarguesonis]